MDNKIWTIVDVLNLASRTWDDDGIHRVIPCVGFILQEGIVSIPIPELIKLLKEPPPMEEMPRLQQYCLQIFRAASYLEETKHEAISDALLYIAPDFDIRCKLANQVINNIPLKYKMLMDDYHIQNSISMVDDLGSLNAFNYLSIEVKAYILRYAASTIARDIN